MEQYALQKLLYWLEYEKHTWYAGAAIVWVPYAYIMHGLTLLALVFGPYMLWRLYQAQWRIAIGVFLVLVAVPFGIGYLYPFQSPILSILFKLLPLFLFYLYTWTLSFMVKERLADLSGAGQFDDMKQQLQQSL